MAPGFVRIAYARKVRPVFVDVSTGTYALAFLSQVNKRRRRSAKKKLLKGISVWASRVAILRRSNHREHIES